MLKCENTYCIYENNGKCSIDKISINSMGQCTECIYFDISKDDLQEFKSRTIEKLDSFTE